MPNRVRYDGQAERFYEVWYTIFADRLSGDGFWIRYTLLNPTDSHPQAGAALWFAHTCRSDPGRSLAIQRTFARGSFEAPTGEARCRIGEGLFEEGVFRGALEAEGHSVSWDLRYDPAPAPHYYFGSLLQRLSEARTSVTIPNPRILLSGRVVIDGRALEVDQAPGHQAHHWGVARAPRWIWGHCCAFEDENAVIELLAPEGPGGVTLTFLNLYTPDQDYLCNGPDSLLFNRSACGLGFWRFEGYTGRHQVIAEISVDPKLVQKFVYHAPTYRASECWNTQVGDCLVRIYRGASAGSQTLERVFRARGTAAAEVHDERPERIPYTAWRSEQKE